MSTLDQHVFGSQLLDEANEELRRLRLVRGAYRRTWRRMSRAAAKLALAAMLLGVPLAGEARARISFGTVVNPFGLTDVGTYARPTLADIDGDGDLDAFIGQDTGAPGQGHTVFFENSGDASSPAFGNPVLDPFGLSPVSGRAAPAFADIDGDGDLDAFIGQYGFDTAFFENTGTTDAPAFDAPSTNPFGLFGTPTFADIDGDGDVDAFTGTPINSQILFFENTGDSSSPAFAAPATNPFNLPTAPLAVPAFADADGDGDVDAFIGDYYGQTIFAENTGTASAPAFGPPIVIDDQGPLAAPAPGDMDGDGDLDLFVGGFNGDTAFWDGLGGAHLPSFAAPSTNPFGLVSLSDYALPTFADIDGDGDLDAFIGTSGPTAFFENTGSATSPMFAASVANPFGLSDVGWGQRAFADIDGDGDLDAFIGEGRHSSGNYGSTIFFRNTGNSSSPAFAAPSTNPFGLIRLPDLRFPSYYYAGVAHPTFADIDGDGDLDAFVGDFEGYLFFFHNTGNSTSAAFAAPSTNTFGIVNAHFPLSGIADPNGAYGGQAMPAFADIDGDGDLDLFVGGGNDSDTEVFFENAGNSSSPLFAFPRPNPFPSPTDPYSGLHYIYNSAPTLVDIDGDGDLDAFVGTFEDTIFFRNDARPRFRSGPVTNPFFLVRAQGDDRFRTLADEYGALFDLAFADIDGDGDLDAFIAGYAENPGENYTFFFENIGDSGSPIFALPSLPNPFGLGGYGYREGMSFADIDGDGDLDVFVPLSDEHLAFFENTGDSSSPAFAAPSTNPFGLPSSVSSVTPALGDIDGDGDLDMFVGSAYDFVLFQNTGSSATPAFAPASTNPFGLYNLGSASIPLSLADIDGDGDLDFASGYEDDVYFFENTGDFSSPAFAPASLNPFGLVRTGGPPVSTFADIDGDGDLDAFILDSYTGELDFFRAVHTGAGGGCPVLHDPACTGGFEKGLLSIDERASGKEKLIAKLIKGPALTQPDFGDPRQQSGPVFDLCLYESEFDLIARSFKVDRAGEQCAGKDCWKSVGGDPPNGKGYKYKDKEISSDGTQTIQLKGGEAGRSKLLWKGKNNAIKGQTSLPLGVAAKLQSTEEATVQLRGSNDTCYEVTLDTIVKQEPDRFKAKFKAP